MNRILGRSGIHGRLETASSLWLELARALAAHLLADLPDLVRKLLLDDLTPDPSTFTSFVWAVLKTGKLCAPFSNQRIQPEKLGFELNSFTLCAFHYVAIVVPS